MILDPIDRDILTAILANFPYTVYAYGSRVKGRCKQFSDLDLCVMGKTEHLELFFLDETFEESNLSIKIDIQEWAPISENFKKLIINDLELIQASPMFLKVERTLFSAFTHLPEKLGFSVIRNNMTLVNCGFNTSTFNTVSDVKIDAQNVEKEIENMIAHFQGQPFAVWLGPSHYPRDLNKHLIEKGFVQETHEFAMSCDLSTFSQNTSTELTIQEVTTKERMKAFSQALSLYDPNIPLFYNHLETFDGPERFFVGYYDGKPVTTGVLFIEQDVAGIFCISTLPAYQKKGFGTDMMIYIMQYAKNLGAPSATLCASSDAGLRIYEKLGFITIGMFACFEWR